MHLLSSLGRDLRQAMRGLSREKGFTATALLTLALCLGTNVVIFTVVRSVVLRPLPFPEPDRLVVVYNSYPKAGVERAGCSWPNYYERKGDALPGFAAGAVVRGGAVNVGDSTGPSRLPVLEAAPELLDVLGVKLAMGRFFQPGEEIYGKNQVVVLTDAYWRTHFAADPDVLGKTMQVNEQAWEIVGVMPPGFRYMSQRFEFIIPIAHGEEEATPQNRHSNNMEYVARLRPGVSLTVAQSQVDALNARMAATDPFAQVVEGAGFRAQVADLHAEHVSQIRTTLLSLQVGVLFLLLIGVVNLVNILLIRATARQRELVLRQVLGAGRGHIALQVVLETLVLTGAGAVLGIALGAASLRTLAALGTDRMPLGTSIAFDGMVAAAAMAVALVVGLLLAAPLVWFNLRGQLAPVLNTESRGGTTTRATHRLRHALIATQIAATFVLLASAGLLGLSFERVLRVQPGFQPDRLLTAQVVLPWTNYREDKDRFAFWQRLVEELRASPGVASVGLTTTLPLSGNNNRNGIWVKGYDPKPGDSIRTHYSRLVTGDFFPAMGVPLREGRLLNDGDGRGEATVCVIDADFAAIYWPGKSALGQIVYPGPPEVEGVKPLTVVGVVGNMKHNDLADTENAGALYMPYREDAGPFNSYLVVRTLLAPEAGGPAVRQALARVDPRLPLDELETMETRMADTLVTRRSPMILAWIFSGVALGLAALGIYGVLAYAVAQRTREIGVRMALGALPDQVLGQFLGLGGRLLLVGTGVGLIGAYFVGRFMSSMLFGISALNPLVLGGTALLLAVVVAIASYLPARRAAHIAPIEALRSD
jgi:predicted permease